jgi:hypothetical protein
MNTLAAAIFKEATEEDRQDEVPQKIKPPLNSVGLVS